MFKAWIVVLFQVVVAHADLDFRKELSAFPVIGPQAFNPDEKADLILVDFWASWCDPCKESFPYYEKEIKKVKNKKILFISVNLDDRVEKAKEFLKENPQSHVTVWDQNKKLMSELGFDSIPYMVILDQDWKIKDNIRGFNDRTKKRIEKFLK